MGASKTRLCCLCSTSFTRRSRWRPKRYCKRRHQVGHYVAVAVGALFS